MPVNVGDIFRIAAVGEAFDQKIMFTHGYTVTSVNPGVSELATAQAIINEVRGGVGGADLLESTYLALLPPEYTLLTWDCQRIRLGRTRLLKTNRNIVGANATTSNAPNQAAVITLQTDAGGRSQVSNKHIGPLPQGPLVQANGQITVGYKALMANLQANLLAPLAFPVDGLNLSPAVFPSNPIAGGSILRAGYVQDTIRVMRRRTVRVGE